MSFNSENELKRDDFIKNTYKFGEICEVLNGRAYKKNELLESGKYTVLRVGNFFSSDNWYYSDLELDANKYCDNGDLLFAWSASFGPKIWDGGKVIYHYHIWKLVPSTFVDKKFLYYWLLFSRSKMLMGVHGSVMGHLTKSSFEKQKISLPDILEQKAIAHILSTLDDKIEVNNQINKTLENMAQAIFKQWFVDFEFPNEDGEPYKSSGGEMVETELGMIPKGWGVEEIENISDIQNGFAFKAPEYVDEGVKVLRTLNIGNDGYFNNTDIVFLPQSYKSEKYEKYYFEEFDVALVMVGASIGKIGMILKNTAGGLQNQNMWRFRRKEKRVSQIFIYYTVKQAQNISKNWSTGSARDFYRKDSFRKIKVILPEKRIMDLFEKITKPIFQNISNHACENDELISMRDGLLPKLMSGEIRVPLDEEGAAS